MLDVFFLKNERIKSETFLQKRKNEREIGNECWEWQPLRDLFIVIFLVEGLLDSNVYFSVLVFPLS